MNTAVTLEAVTSDARADALLSVENEMVRVLRAVRRSLLENAQRFSPEIQPSGYSVLRFVVANHPTPPGEIIAGVGMDKSAVSRQLRILKDLGFLTSVPDPDDRRASLFAPTEETLRRMDAIRREMQAGYAERLRDWSEDDLAQFARLLGAFNDRIERR